MTAVYQLLYDRNAAAQLRQIPIAHIYVVNQNFTALNVVIAGYQIDYRRFSRAGRSHERRFFALGKFERNAFQHPVFFVVGKPYVAEFNFARYIAGVAVLARFSVAVVEQFVNTVGQDERRLHGRILFSEVVDRVEELFPRSL